MSAVFRCKMGQLNKKLVCICPDNHRPSAAFERGRRGAPSGVCAAPGQHLNHRAGPVKTKSPRSFCGTLLWCFRLSPQRQIQILCMFIFMKMQRRPQWKCSLMPPASYFGEVKTSHPALLEAQVVLALLCHLIVFLSVSTQKPSHSSPHTLLLFLPLSHWLCGCPCLGHPHFLRKVRKILPVL